MNKMNKFRFGKSGGVPWGPRCFRTMKKRLQPFCTILHNDELVQLSRRLKIEIGGRLGSGDVSKHKHVYTISVDGEKIRREPPRSSHPLHC